MKKEKSIIREMLKLNEVEVNGSKPRDIQVYHEKFFQCILSDGVLGLGESYMDGWWDCDDLEEFKYKVLKAELKHKISHLKLLVPVIISKITNLQNKIGIAKDVS